LGLVLALVTVLAVIGTVGAVFYALNGFEPPKEPQIINTAHYVNLAHGSSAGVYGEVQNTLNVNIKNLYVNGTFYDSEGNVIGEDQRDFVFPDFLKPNQKGAFSLDVFGKETREKLAKYEISVSYETTEEKPVEGLSVLNPSSFISESGNYTITGEVKNNGKMKVIDVIVYCTFYDGAGKVIGYWFADTDPTYIYSGQTAPFQLEWDMDTQISPARYELQVGGKVG
jgi:hypothetical protein